MRNINFSGSLSEFKDSIGMKQPKRGKNADAQRKTAEGVVEAMKGLVEIDEFEKSLPPDATLSPRIVKRREEYKKFVYENRLYKTNPKKVKTK